MAKSQLGSSSAERVPRLRAHSVRNPRSAARTCPLLPLLALPQAATGELDEAGPPSLRALRSSSRCRLGRRVGTRLRLRLQPPASLAKEPPRRRQVPGSPRRRQNERRAPACAQNLTGRLPHRSPASAMYRTTRSTNGAVPFLAHLVGAVMSTSVRRPRAAGRVGGPPGGQS